MCLHVFDLLSLENGDNRNKVYFTLGIIITVVEKKTTRETVYAHPNTDACVSKHCCYRKEIIIKYYY
jgi:hypothetical protein